MLGRIELIIGYWLLFLFWPPGYFIRSDSVTSEEGV